MFEDKKGSKGENLRIESDCSLDNRGPSPWLFMEANVQGRFTT